MKKKKEKLHEDIKIVLKLVHEAKLRGDTMVYLEVGKVKYGRACDYIEEKYGNICLPALINGKRYWTINLVNKWGGTYSENI